MKGVILAGGLGTRLYPLTHATNKHLLPVYDKPMIYYPIQTLVNAGIKDVLLVVGGPHAGDFIRVLENGKQFGLDHMEFAYQSRPDGGIADALSLAEDFSDGGPVTVILGDNTTDFSIRPYVENFKEGACIFIKRVSDPERFGVPVFGRAKLGAKPRIIRIEEKPKEPKSEYCVVGVYIYDNEVFDIVRNIKPSERGQLEITDVNNTYIAKGKMDWVEMEGFWTDAGTPSSLLKANLYWALKRGIDIL